MVAARGVGLVWFLEKRRKEHSDFQQGAEGTKPRGGVLPLTADVRQRKTMKSGFIVAVAIGACALSAMATTERDLRDTWINAFPSQHVADKVGAVTWISISFSTNRTINWTWNREGKIEAHSGRYRLHPEPGGSGELQMSTTVVIIPTTLAIRRPIVLKDVEVDGDSRFPVEWTVLKCKDVGDNQMVFLREMNHKERRTSASTVRLTRDGFVVR
jgi:hypothetical protein